MNIIDELKNTLQQAQADLEKEVSFQELQNFYNEMKGKGLVIKKEYSLPPLDTIGHYSQVIIPHP